mmetsp:Transcript_89526/g.255709  ORF Transcript_89526/g.255709 Transcript_89526/m.255709 type:complete len:341 (-) Transcript_89526:600-1622(-)
MAGGAKITPGSPKKGGALTKATSPRNKGGDDESIDSALSDDDGSDYDSVSDEENEEKKEEDESETTGTGKRKGKRMIAGETEEEITDKMFRDQARKAELQDTLSQFMEKPKVVEVVKKKEFKNHTWLPIPVYGWRLRRALDCCVHVPLEDAVLESNVGQVRSFLVRWSKRKEGFERINQVDEKGRGALSLALKEGREDIADFIISIGEANPNISDKDTKLKPLHHAVMQDQVNTIQKLAWRSGPTAFVSFFACAVPAACMADFLTPPPPVHTHICGRASQLSDGRLQRRDGHDAPHACMQIGARVRLRDAYRDGGKLREEGQVRMDAIALRGLRRRHRHH